MINRDGCTSKASHLKEYIQLETVKVAEMQKFILVNTLRQDGQVRVP